LHYRIAVRHESGRKISDYFVVEAAMNYRLPEISQQQRSGFPKSKRSPLFKQGIETWAKECGGIIVVHHAIAEDCLSALLQQQGLTTLVIFEDEIKLNAFRKNWYASGIYGTHVTAQLAKDLPLEFANGVLVDVSALRQAIDWLSPSGSLLCVSNDQPKASAYRDVDFAWSNFADGLWLGVHSALEQLSKWDHQYGSPSNASFVNESLGGVDDTSDLEVRWLGRPGADFGIDRNPRMPAPLVVGGRLFHQGMNRMIAVDAFNGAILWSLEIPKLRRVNIPRDCGNWCADESRVYAAVEDQLWVINAATGEMLHTIEPPERYGSGFDWGFVATTANNLVGTVVPSGGIYEDFWDKPSWYDGINDAAASKVCGRNLMVFDKKYGDLRWQREADAILHSTITIHQDHVFFVEVKDPGLDQSSSGRLSDSQIWSNASVVCVDLQSGEEKWASAVPTSKSVEVIAFGLADDDQFILETSSNGQFHLASFDSATGKSRWTKSSKWSEDNHGGHMQHAVLMDGKIFLQPSILDASTGEILKTDTLGKRRGCATPIGAGGSIIYRGGTGPVSLWSLESEQPSEFARLRPSCWLSTIPAHGMLFSPEAGGGCSCGGWMECSIGFAPRRNRLPYAEPKD
jgi:outer membrane protein assembly factor BamB